MDKNYKNPIEKANKINKIAVLAAFVSIATIGFYGYNDVTNHSDRLKNSFNQQFPYDSINNIVLKRHYALSNAIKGLTNKVRVSNKSLFQDLSSQYRIDDAKFIYFIPKNHKKIIKKSFIGFVANNMADKTVKQSKIIEPEIATLNNQTILYYATPYTENGITEGALIIGYNISVFTENMLKEFFSLNIEHFQLEQTIGGISYSIIANDYQKNESEKNVSLQETHWKFTGWNDFNYNNYITALSVHGAGYMMIILLIIFGLGRFYRGNKANAQRELQLFMEEVAKDNTASQSNINFLLDSDPESKKLFNKDYSSRENLLSKKGNRTLTKGKSVFEKIKPAVKVNEPTNEPTDGPKTLSTGILFHTSKDGIGLANDPVCSPLDYPRNLEHPHQVHALIASVYFGTLIKSNKGDKNIYVAFEDSSALTLIKEPIIDGLSNKHDDIFCLGLQDKYVVQEFIKPDDALVYISNNTQLNSPTLSLFMDGCWSESKDYQNINQNDWDQTASSVCSEYPEKDVVQDLVQHHQADLRILNAVSIAIISTCESTREVLKSMYEDTKVELQFFENPMSLKNTMSKKTFDFGFEIKRFGMEIYNSSGNPFTKSEKQLQLAYLAAKYESDVSITAPISDVHHYLALCEQHNCSIGFVDNNHIQISTNREVHAIRYLRDGIFILNALISEVSVNEIKLDDLLNKAQGAHSGSMTYSLKASLSSSKDLIEQLKTGHHVTHQMNEDLIIFLKDQVCHIKGTESDTTMAIDIYCLKKIKLKQAHSELEKNMKTLDQAFKVIH
jgi:hypothetical protein